MCRTTILLCHSVCTTFPSHIALNGSCILVISCFHHIWVYQEICHSLGTLTSLLLLRVLVDKCLVLLLGTPLFCYLCHSDIMNSFIIFCPSFINVSNCTWEYGLMLFFFFSCRCLGISFLFVKICIVCVKKAIFFIVSWVKMQLYLKNFLIIFDPFTSLKNIQLFPWFSCLRSYLLPAAAEKFLPSRYALRTPASSSSRLP